MHLLALVECFACHETETTLALVKFPRVLIHSNSPPPATNPDEVIVGPRFEQLDLGDVRGYS